MERWAAGREEEEEFAQLFFQGNAGQKWGQTDGTDNENGEYGVVGRRGPKC